MIELIRFEILEYTLLIDQFEKRIQLLFEPRMKVQKSEIARGVLHRVSVYQLSKSFDSQERVVDEI